MLAGEQAAIARDIEISGATAFKAGERVVVEKVDPDPQQPRFRYVVRSKTLGTHYRLSDHDIVQNALPGAEPSVPAFPITRPGTHSDQATPLVYEALTSPGTFTLKGSRRWVIGIAVAILMLAVFVGITLVSTSGHGVVEQVAEKAADQMIGRPAGLAASARMCQANQRMMNAAIDSYHAAHEQWPVNVEAVLPYYYKPQWDVCPATGTYRWVPGAPPRIECGDPTHLLPADDPTTPHP